MAVQDVPEFFMDVHVRYAEVGPDGKARLSAVADWFQEAAGLNADELGFGDNLVFSQGLTWILTRMIFYVKAMPTVGQTVRVRTWPAKMEHLGHRGYELLDAEGAPIIRATGAWTVMDLETRRIVPMPQPLLDAYPRRTIDCVPFASTVEPRLREAVREVPIRVRRDDLDLNGHVNNARYLGWLLEPLEAGGGEELSMLEVAFRAECFPGETLMSRCSGALAAKTGLCPQCADETERIHAIGREDAAHPGKETDVCRALTRWRPAKKDG